MIDQVCAAGRANPHAAVASLFASLLTTLLKSLLTTPPR
jgi:hypothetical protein